MNDRNHQDDQEQASGESLPEGEGLPNEDRTIDEAAMGQTIAEQTMSESEFVSASGSGSGASMGTPPPGEAEVPQVEGYRVIEPLGQGGMGTVWRAIQLSTSREVALKLLGGASFMSEQARPRFEREIRLAARLEHNNIATIYDSGIERGVYYYAMQLVQGEPLDEFILKRQLKRKYILKLVQIVCTAVQHAHEQGIVHRDLKPSNIMVTSSGKPVVLDFGLAKMLGEDDEQEMTLTGVGDIAGTPAYMAPEQAEGRIEAIGPQTDVYALGAILFRMLTGDSPTDLSGSKLQVLNRIATGEVRSPSAIKPAIDHELEALLLKALAVSSEDRYQSAGEMARAIAKYRERLKAGLVTQTADEGASGAVEDSGLSVHYSGLQTQQIPAQTSNLLDELAEASGEASAVQDFDAFQMERGRKNKAGLPVGLIIGGAAAALLIVGAVIYALTAGGPEPEQPGPLEVVGQPNVPKPSDLASNLPRPPAEPIVETPINQPPLPEPPVNNPGPVVDGPPPLPGPGPSVEPNPAPQPPIDEAPPVIDNNVTARQAAEWVLANGGEVTVQAENLFPNQKLVWITRPEDLPADLARIDGVRLQPNGPDQFRHLPKLNALPGFKALIIEAGPSDLKDDPIPELAQLTGLTYFRISGERIDNAFMEHLKSAENLQYLKMLYIELDPDHFEHLREMTGLTNLTIRYTRINNEHFTHMQRLRKLTYAEVSQCTGFDYRAVHNLVDLPRLKGLSLAGARLDDVGTKPLMKMKQLEHLNIVKTGVSPEGAVRLQLALPDCKIMVREGEVFRLPAEHLNKPDRGTRPDQDRPDRPRPPRRDEQR